MRIITMARLMRGLLIAVIAALGGSTSIAQTDEKLSKRIEKLDVRLVKAFVDLAQQYDGLKDPEAAHLYGDVIGRELRAQGYNQSIGGGVNLARDPRNVCLANDEAERIARTPNRAAITGSSTALNGAKK